MKLDKFSTMFSDFRFWLTEKIYDELRVGKRNLVKEYNYSFLANAFNQEQLSQGNILQVDGISGNCQFAIRFNEINSPQFIIQGRSTFRIPFWRFFISCNHYGGLVASQIRIKVLPNCKYDSLNTVDLAGKNTNILKYTGEMRSVDFVVPAGGNVNINFQTIAGSGFPIYLNYFLIYNPDMAITLGLQIDASSANTFPLFPTQAREFNFPRPYWVNAFFHAPAINPGFTVVNGGANPVTVNTITGYTVDNFFI